MQKSQKIMQNIQDKKVAFLIAFFVIFTLSYGVLYALDFYPETIKSEARELVPVATTTPVTKPEEPVVPKIVTPPSIVIGNSTLPIKLVIPALDKSVAILNPAAKSVSALDTALLSGVVRHPDSAVLGENGTVFVMGHSSYLPVVHNRNFQALNGIQNLKWGDTISLFSSDTEYVYRVEKVYKAKASALTVPVKGNEKTLTLATCNSFGSKDDRFIVEATLVKTNP